MIASDPNRAVLEIAARRLDALGERIVYLGGSVIGLLITDPAVAPVRETDDVDVVVEVTTRTAYRRIEAKLVKQGFRHDTSPNAPICRFIVDRIKVDVMPIDEKVLGFSNRWYPAALERPVPVRLSDDIEILVVDAPIFLATKLEAFKNRGGGDHRMSHDLEDLVAVVDGRPEIVDETKRVSQELRQYLRVEIGALLDSDNFLDAMPGFIGGDPGGRARLPIVQARLRRIVDDAIR